MAKANILLVESDAVASISLMIFLVGNEYNVMCVATIEEAIQHCDQHIVDIIITELSSKVNGFRLVGYLNEQKKSPIVIGVVDTQPDNILLLTLAGESGINIMFKKPVTQDLLLGYIEKELRERQLFCGPFSNN